MRRVLPSAIAGVIMLSVAAPVWAALKIGDQAPPLTVTDWVKGKPFDLATDGRGRVEGKKPSHIFRFQRPDRGKGEDARRLLVEIERRFSGLPFAERWTAPLVRRTAPVLRQLVRSGGITEYPILSEVGRGIVSQAEHTVLVLDSGNEITTL